ncbi:MAG: hypothetical protein UT48_C0017G0012 [Parcubacteria group bacterium GW2011_GWE2_39_37]|uniref:Uncharacterized protein n=1 Tax=Candidatus Falkowbacteria bacterium GW2011_GWF2_39_8 TaxID=1618642 RepID=A0A0G0T3N2_9BACT|nr:MAG: hypothetical protein UT48_C0017G0012 [Parcubacteria group bacterium GW2011_GWE2_39_37]KKR32452.1 MAG: hypothetical protein UT64_C0034G0008 [Candidatus Falkowbacteria bacterium GW2011_GWF2_39_8]
MVQGKEIAKNLGQEKLQESIEAKKPIVQAEKETVAERFDFGVQERMKDSSTNTGQAEGEKLVSVSGGSNPLGDQFAARQKKIEKIMEEGMADIYVNLSPEKKNEFKTVGERTAYQVNILLSETKVKVKKVIELIINWLKIIPGVNAFFLEKEAKIKVEEMIRLKNEKGGESE